MKKLFLLFLGLSLPIQAGAFEIVYPKSNNISLESDKTFFIGNENPQNTLTINGKEVPIHPFGGFKYTVNLEEGENCFIITNGETTAEYKITRLLPKKVKSLQYKEFEKSVTVETIKDRVPLRSTPTDSGLNRLQHLDKGIVFTAIGEYGEFYKVKLARDDYAWISKSDVNQVKEENLKSKILHYEFNETQKARIYKIKLDKKTPYVISESHGLDVVLYNMEDYNFDKYEFHIPAEKLFGYSSYYEADNTLVIKIPNPPSKNTLVVTIDAGHGGDEYGAIGCLGDKEKDINLEIAKILQKKLEDKNIKTFMTREEDVNVSLSDRVKFANKNNSNIFISIHNNAYSDTLADKEATGSEVYYFYPQSKKLAQSILKTLTEELQLKNNGVKAQSFAVLRNTEALCILVEAAFMINPDDNAKLQSEKFKNDVAEAILHGLENFINGK